MNSERRAELRMEPRNQCRGKMLHECLDEIDRLDNQRLDTCEREMRYVRKVGDEIEGYKADIATLTAERDELLQTVAVNELDLDEKRDMLNLISSEGVPDATLWLAMKQQRDDAIAERDELLKTVKLFYHTVDGVLITPKMDVWQRETRDACETWQIVKHHTHAWFNPFPGYSRRRCYSTEALAEASLDRNRETE